MSSQVETKGAGQRHLAPGSGPDRWSTPSPRLWTWLSMAAAVLAMVGSVVGLLDVDGIYGQETPGFIDQAVAQDVVNLVVVSPAILVLAMLARRGSLRAYLVWLGLLAFTVYNYVIYTGSVHFGPLFLLWVAVLGLALYALVGGVAVTDPNRVRARFGGAPVRQAGWFLVLTATLFAALWLREIVPALLSGTELPSARDLALPTNPVHVLDLSLFLPAVFLAGVHLLRRHPLGYLAAPASVVFVVCTGLPILITPAVAAVRGDSAQWSVLAPIGVITVLGLFVLLRFLAAGPPPDPGFGTGRVGAGTSSASAP